MTSKNANSGQGSRRCVWWSIALSRDVLDTVPWRKLRSWLQRCQSEHNGWNLVRPHVRPRLQEKNLDSMIIGILIGGGLTALCLWMLRKGGPIVMLVAVAVTLLAGFVGFNVLIAAGWSSIHGGLSDGAFYLLFLVALVAPPALGFLAGALGASWPSRPAAAINALGWSSRRPSAAGPACRTRAG